MQRPADGTRKGLPIEQNGGKELKERCIISNKGMLFFGPTAICAPNSAVGGGGNENFKTDINVTVAFDDIECVPNKGLVVGGN